MDTLSTCAEEQRENYFTIRGFQKGRSCCCHAVARCIHLQHTTLQRLLVAV